MMIGIVIFHKLNPLPLMVFAIIALGLSLFLIEKTSSISLSEYPSIEPVSHPNDLNFSKDYLY